MRLIFVDKRTQFTRLTWQIWMPHLSDCYIDDGESSALHFWHAGFAGHRLDRRSEPLRLGPHPITFGTWTWEVSWTGLIMVASRHVAADKSAERQTMVHTHFVVCHQFDEIVYRIKSPKREVQRQRRHVSHR